MKTKTADVPLKSTLGMIGWNPTTFVDQTMEYFHLDVENGASPKVLSSNLHNVAGKRQDAIVNDALGYGRLLRYLARNFISKVITHLEGNNFLFKPYVKGSMSPSVLCGGAVNSDCLNITFGLSSKYGYTMWLLN